MLHHFNKENDGEKFYYSTSNGINAYRKSKGAVMISGSKSKIINFIKKIDSFVGEKNEVNELACIPLKELKKNNEVFFGYDKNQNKKNYKMNMQYDMLWKGTNDNDSWIDFIIKSYYNEINIDNIYLISVMYKNKTNIMDGVPFIGGSKNDLDKDLYETAKRELFEEIKSFIRDEDKIIKIPTLHDNFLIWHVNINDIISII